MGNNKNRIFAKLAAWNRFFPNPKIFETILDDGEILHNVEIFSRDKDGCTPNVRVPTMVLIGRKYRDSWG